MELSEAVRGGAVMVGVLLVFAVILYLPEWLMERADQWRKVRREYEPLDLRHWTGEWR